MLRLFNTLGRRVEPFHPVKKDAVKIFSCGPSVYQRSHIGNFRTFLFEDILIRYLESLGHRVIRGMTVTDLEDKAIEEAEKRGTSLRNLTDTNIKAFVKEMELLRIKLPDYLPRASDTVETAVEVIDALLNSAMAYRYRGNIYFNPLKYDKFGEIYGLDLSRWPAKKMRFHKDTYPGMRWNLGDFIIWHGSDRCEEYCWNTKIGKGRPSWNIQDPTMVIKYFDETLSIYCGGIDNLVRHHDYSSAVFESVKSYPMAKFWLHGNHLFVHGQKMSKSKGNIYYTDTLLDKGFSIGEIRFFLIYGHYRKNLNYTDKRITIAAEKLRKFKLMLKAVKAVRGNTRGVDMTTYGKAKTIFEKNMNNDLDIKGAFDALNGYISGLNLSRLKRKEASGILNALKEIDEVLKVLY